MAGNPACDVSGVQVSIAVAASVEDAQRVFCQDQRSGSHREVATRMPNAFRPAPSWPSARLRRSASNSSGVVVALTRCGGPNNHAHFGKWSRHDETGPNFPVASNCENSRFIGNTAAPGFLCEKNNARPEFVSRTARTIWSDHHVATGRQHLLS